MMVEAWFEGGAKGVNTIEEALAVVASPEVVELMTRIMEATFTRKLLQGYEQVTAPTMLRPPTIEWNQNVSAFQQHPYRVFWRWYALIKKKATS